ncbi:MAG: endo alpha-1,4 polygalactosaminidase [Candidatus Woesearchaeota archaeon]
MNKKNLIFIFIFSAFFIVFFIGCKKIDFKDLKEENLVKNIEKNNFSNENAYENNSNQDNHTLKNKFVDELIQNNISKKINSSLYNNNPYKNLRNNDWLKPSKNLSWHWQLNGNLNMNYTVLIYDIDLFDNSKETIEKLHNKGIKVICYFSAGTYEDFRPDKEDFPKEILGKTLDEWQNEKWLDIRKIDILRPIMIKRFDLAVEKGCDALELDNVDGYQNENGFSLTYEDQLKYNIWLSEEAHKRNLFVGLKNDLDQINDLVDYYDFAINEKCFEYDECEKLIPFIEKNKAVLGVEYNLEMNEFCEKANKLNFSWLKMDYELDGKRKSCISN